MKMLNIRCNSATMQNKTFREMRKRILEGNFYFAVSKKTLQYVGLFVLCG